MPPVSSAICTHVHITTKHINTYLKIILNGLQKVWRALPTSSGQFSLLRSVLVHGVRPEGQFKLF